MKVRLRQNPEYPTAWWVETRRWYQLRWRRVGAFDGYEQALKVARAIKHPNMEEVK